MGTLAQKTVNDQLVFYDSAYGWRWLDAFGPNVAKFLQDFVQCPFAAADSPADFDVTLVEGGGGETTIALVDGATGGELLITTDAAEHDGANLHAHGEAFYFASAWPAYFGIRLKVSDSDESVLWAGLGLSDTNWDTGAPDDYIAFYSADAAATVNFQVAQDGTATSLEGVHTLVDNTYVTLEWYYDGTTVYAYVNGVLVGSIAASNANFPNDEYLTPTIDFTTGEGNAATCTVDWIRAIQIQQ